jgi:hypothetical protein
MRFLFGMIFGIAIAVAGAFAYDNANGHIANGLQPTAGAEAPIVNWGVLNDDWSKFTLNLRHIGDDVNHEWERLSSRQE